MSIIPLDFQRRCEQRWAARFSRSVEPVASRKQGPERESQQIVASGEAKEKPARLSRRATGLRRRRGERGTEAPRLLIFTAG
jgi:hypothetical protein